MSRTEIGRLWGPSHPECALVQAHPLLHRPRQDRSVSHLRSSHWAPLWERFPHPAINSLHLSPWSAGTLQCHHRWQGSPSPALCMGSRGTARVRLFAQAAEGKQAPKALHGFKTTGTCSPRPDSAAVPKAGSVRGGDCHFPTSTPPQGRAA